MKTHDDDWSDLVGQEVLVQKNGHIIRTGRVEAVTPAADAVWIAGHGVEQRAMYEKAEGHRILPATGEAREDLDQSVVDRPMGRLQLK